MITNWNELGDVLAEFENRISLMENLNTPSDASLNSPDRDKAPERIEARELPGITYNISQEQSKAFKELEERVQKLDFASKKDKGDLYA